MRARSGVCIYDWLPQPATDDKGFRATCLCARTMEPALGHVHQLARLLHTVLGRSESGSAGKSFVT
eukprot:COSAG06_NODE_7574_length_2454_cov_1.941401_3_plen_66_part_00